MIAWLTGRTLSSLGAPTIRRFGQDPSQPINYVKYVPQVYVWSVVLSFFLSILCGYIAAGREAKFAVKKCRYNGRLVYRHQLFSRESIVFRNAFVVPDVWACDCRSWCSFWWLFTFAPPSETRSICFRSFCSRRFRFHKHAMKLTFLGTATSYGVPFVACDCAVCTSTNPRNKRLRSSVFVETSSTRILIDTTPDLRAQLLRENIRDISAVCWTHAHNDHIIGLDDLRPICNKIGYVPAFANADTLGNLQRIFGYAFVPNQEANFPRITPHILEPLETVEIGDIRITALPISHGKLPIFAYRLETFNQPEKAANRVLVYATDCSHIPDASRDLMTNADVLVLGALRHNPHPAHFTVQEALREVKLLQPQRTFLTHIGHELEHDETNASLPSNVQLAFDGLNVEI